MHEILFNRISDSSYFLGTFGKCDTKEEADELMKKHFKKFMEKGFDPRFSSLHDDCFSAFISTYDMSDVIILLNHDTENPCGIEYNPYLEFAIMAHENGMLGD